MIQLVSPSELRAAIDRSYAAAVTRVETTPTIQLIPALANIIRAEVTKTLELLYVETPQLYLSANFNDPMFIHYIELSSNNPSILIRIWIQVSKIQIDWIDSRNRERNRTIDCSDFELSSSKLSAQLMYQFNQLQAAAINMLGKSND